MSLYKHLPPERIAVLTDATLVVGLSAERNDPFYELVSVDWERGDEELRRPHAALSSKIPFEKYADHQRIQPETRRAEASARLRAKQDDCFGAICLSRVWDSIPMWSYYAREHQGFVVEFDDTHPAFTERFVGILVPIIYDC